MALLEHLARLSWPDEMISGKIYKKKINRLQSQSDAIENQVCNIVLSDFTYQVVKCFLTRVFLLLMSIQVVVVLCALRWS